MSFCITVTYLTWRAHRLVSSQRPTKQASYKAPIAAFWKRRSGLKSWAISCTRCWKGSLRIRSSVDFWSSLISRSARFQACNMRLLHPSSRGHTLVSGFCSQLLPRCFTTCPFASSQLCTSHGIEDPLYPPSPSAGAWWARDAVGIREQWQCLILDFLITWANKSASPLFCVVSLNLGSNF